MARIPLVLHPDRLFPPDPATRELARRLYATVKDLPIVSPHGHTDPQWFADNPPFANASALFITPDHYVFRMLYSQGVPLDGPRHSAARRRRRRAGRAQDLAHVRRALSPLPRHADADLARPRVLDRVRRRRAAHRRIGRSRVRPHQRVPRRSGIPAARAVRALQHRGARDDRIAARSARASRQDPGERLEGARGDRVPARSGRRSRVRRLSRQRSRAWRDDGREHVDVERLSRRAPAAPRVLQDDGRDVDRSRPSHGDDLRSPGVRLPAAARPRALGHRDPGRGRAVPRADADRDGEDEPRRRARDADPSRAASAITIRSSSATMVATRAPTFRRAPTMSAR